MVRTTGDVHVSKGTLLRPKQGTRTYRRDLRFGSLRYVLGRKLHGIYLVGDKVKPLDDDFPMDCQAGAVLGVDSPYELLDQLNFDFQAVDVRLPRCDKLYDPERLERDLIIAGIGTRGPILVVVVVVSHVRATALPFNSVHFIELTIHERLQQRFKIGVYKSREESWVDD